jgi:hypothetical protein
LRQELAETSDMTTLKVVGGREHKSAEDGTP